MTHLSNMSIRTHKVHKNVHLHIINTNTINTYIINTNAHTYIINTHAHTHTHTCLLFKKRSILSLFDDGHITRALQGGVTHYDVIEDSSLL